MRTPTELLPGTLDMLILKAASLRPLHGYGILLRIGQISGHALDIPQGSLYPALYRLEEKGWIEGEPGTSPEGRRVKLYSLTARGRRQLAEEHDGWRLFAGAVERVLAAG
jgi:transcriptional regulator